MSEPKFRSDLPVTMDADATCGSDRAIARRAWVVHPKSDDERDYEAGHRRVIRAMMKGRHGTPFEAGCMSVYVEAPAVVWWEWTRHRFMSMDTHDFGFNLESGRYKILDGQFYIPPPERPIVEPEGFKPMRPELEDPDQETRINTQSAIRNACSIAWLEYQEMTGECAVPLQKPVAREVARLVLPFNTYYAGYVSANPRTWLHFFSLRRRHASSAVKSFPQWEIDNVAEQCETLFESRWPITLSEFNDNGRVAPGA